MEIQKLTNPIFRCDTALCNFISKFKVDTNSYKGDIYLCESCFKKFQQSLKRMIRSDEEKK